MANCKIFIIILALSCGFGNSQEPYGTSFVTELTMESFDSHIQQNKYTFVEFYAPWCGVCQKFTPEFENAASTLHQFQIVGVEQPFSVSFAKLDAWNENHINITSRFSVSGYPTCILFIDGAPAYKYDGDHFSQSVIDKMSRKLRPDYVTIASIDEIQKLKTLERVVVVGLLENQQSEGELLGMISYQQEWNVFSAVSQKNKEQFLFGVHIVENEATKTELMNLFNVTELPASILFKSYEEGVSSTLNVGLTTDQFSQWVHYHKFPLLGDISKENSELYIHSGIPLVFVFVADEEQKTLLAGQLAPVATETKLRLNFVFINSTKYGSQAPKFGLSGNTVPCIAIENTTSRFHYAFNESLEISEENVRRWVNLFLEGSLKPSWRSQPVSLTNTSEAVIQVVGANYEEIVLNNPKDVFIEFYAPCMSGEMVVTDSIGCGHCKSLEPVWQEIAEFVLKKNKKYGGVVFAKMDATENDIPSVNDTVNSYPTIRLFKAGDKLNPVTFTNTHRSATSLLQFVQDNASQPHKLKKIVKKYLKKKKEEKIAKLWQFDDDSDNEEKELEGEFHGYHDEDATEQKDEL